MVHPGFINKQWNYNRKKEDPEQRTAERFWLTNYGQMCHATKMYGEVEVPHILILGTKWR
jgi:hypothetical protein